MAYSFLMGGVKWQVLISLVTVAGPERMAWNCEKEVSGWVVWKISSLEGYGVWNRLSRSRPQAASIQVVFGQHWDIGFEF